MSAICWRRKTFPKGIKLSIYYEIIFLKTISLSLSDRCRTRAFRSVCCKSRVQIGILSSEEDEINVTLYLKNCARMARGRVPLCGAVVVKAHNAQVDVHISRGVDVPLRRVSSHWSGRRATTQ